MSIAFSKSARRSGRTSASWREDVSSLRWDNEALRAGHAEMARYAKTLEVERGDWLNCDAA
jgi:hypothetical protein